MLNEKQKQLLLELVKNGIPGYLTDEEVEQAKAIKKELNSP